jgi:hypothetical protein
VSELRDLQRCPRCDTVKSLNDFPPSHRGKQGEPCTGCNTDRVRKRRVADPEANRAKVAAWRKANPRYAQAESLRRNYGMTLEEYDALFEAQSGVCATCRQPETRIYGRTGRICNLHVDHDHETGKVRGLLCHRCNMALGYALDNAATLRALADYVEAAAVVLR